MHLKSLSPFFTVTADVVVKRWVIDSRKVTPGDGFVAWRGQHVDGYDYIDAAIARGAVAIIADRPCPQPIPQAIASEVEAALLAAAKQRRAAYQGTVIGITGSCGKSSSKQMCTTLLSEHCAVFFNHANENTPLGIAMNFLTLEDQQVAVVEMGISQVGEMEALCELVQPTIGIITHIGPSHLQGLGSVDQVFEHKTKLLTSLPQHGMAIVDGDSEYCQRWLTHPQIQAPIHTFALHHPASITAESVRRSDRENQTSFTVCYEQWQQRITLPVLGEHHIKNFLIAALILAAFGWKWQLPASPQSLFVAQRGSWYRLSAQRLLIDDSYNANPASFRAAMEAMPAWPQASRIIIAADMAELGDLSQQAHEELATAMQDYGIDQLYATGDWMRYTVQKFGQGASFYPTLSALQEAINLPEKCVILVKGSRSAQLEQIVSSFRGADHEG